MSKFGVTRAKEQQLVARMADLGIREEDLVEKFILGSGPGGQKLNKTSSCVYLLHRPTGIEVKCRQTRSQALNRFHARRELCARIEERELGRRSARMRAIARIRRQKQRRSRRQKEKVLAAKHQRSLKKLLRKPPAADD